MSTSVVLPTPRSCLRERQVSRNEVDVYTFSGLEDEWYGDGDYQRVSMIEMQNERERSDAVYL